MGFLLSNAITVVFIIYSLICYMFRSYDHLQAEIYIYICRKLHYWQRILCFRILINGMDNNSDRFLVIVVVVAVLHKLLWTSMNTSSTHQAVIFGTAAHNDSLEQMASSTQQQFATVNAAQQHILKQWIHYQ
jgi:hypothetical protein